MQSTGQRPVPGGGERPRLLVVVGSGETAPTMVRVHRAVLERVGGPAVLLDTPYGFQVNADDVTRRAVAYFATSVGRRVEPVPWRANLPAGPDRERALAALRGAAWVFAGPGSPSYALRHWLDTPVPQLLAGKLATGGAVVFASAAAATLGTHAVPVYEIYKAGADPHWLPGLGLLERAIGLAGAVIPHFDNAEGGHYDTRYCYLGERRLAALEAELPEHAAVLGVDEHTACLLDLKDQTATVLGKGRVTLRRRGQAVTFPAGVTVRLAELTAAAAGPVPAAPPPPAEPPRDEPAASLRAEADRLDAAFSAALAARDVAGGVAAALALEQALADWSADTLLSSDGAHARQVLRGMIVRLGELAEAGARDPAQLARAYVEPLLGLRARFRAAGDYATADALRDVLTGAGVEVQDTPEGPRWRLRRPP